MKRLLKQRTTVIYINGGNEKWKDNNDENSDYLLIQLSILLSLLTYREFLSQSQ